MKKRIKSAVSFFIGSLFSVFSCWLGIYFNPDTERCGKIREIAQQPIVHKQTTTYNSVFVVEFENGEWDKVHPTTKDLYTRKVGERVCYVVENHRGWTLLCFISIIIGVIFSLAFLLIPD